MLILTEQEIQALTGRQRRPAQTRALKWMGIEHRVRPDGSLAVVRQHNEALREALRDLLPRQF